MTQLFRVAIVNFVTASGLVCGLLSIYAAWHLEFVLQCWLLTACLIADGADGYLARKLGAETRFGAMADTFADFVAFGISPAVAIMVSFGPASPATLILAVLWVAASLARLHHFMQTNDAQNTDFKGLPLAAASFFLMALVISTSDRLGVQSILVIIIMLTAMMLSRIEFKRDLPTLGATFVIFGIFWASTTQADLQIHLTAMQVSVVYVIVSLVRAVAAQAVGGFTRAAAGIK